MNVILSYHSDSLLGILYHKKKRRERFAALLNDRPTDAVVQTRQKQPDADLKRGYRSRFLAAATLAFAVNSLAFLAVPTYTPPPKPIVIERVVMNVEDIPETRQVMRAPALTRPEVPIAVEGDLAPDDVTIASTELDLDQMSFDLPQLALDLPVGVAQEEEALELWSVEEKPQIIRQVEPEYPRTARKAGVEGTVFLKVLVSRQGSVKDAQVVRGKEIFHKAALQAVYQFEFSPARQSDKPVDVWMMIPLTFRLTG